MKYLFLLMLAIQQVSFASDNIVKFDLSGCIEKNCMSNELPITINPEPNVKIQAGFNLMHWKDSGGTKFYPLFQLYNLTGKPVQIVIGMQLLDNKNSILLEATESKLMVTAKSEEPTYETGLSINAAPITKEIIQNAKFVRIIYKRKAI